ASFVFKDLAESSQDPDSRAAPRASLATGSNMFHAKRRGPGARPEVAVPSGWRALRCACLSPIAVRRNRQRPAENGAEGIAGPMEGDTLALPNGAIYRKV